MGINYDDNATNAESLAEEFYLQHGSDGINHESLVALIRKAQKQGFHLGADSGFLAGYDACSDNKPCDTNDAARKLTAEMFTE